MKYPQSERKEAEKELLKMRKQVESMPMPKEEDIKFYPGSIKGPEPEDDPEAYIDWFVRNRPPSLAHFDTPGDNSMVGIKPIYKRPKEDQDKMIVLDPVHEFDNVDMPIPGEGVNPTPEFLFSEKSTYGKDEDAKMPSVIIASEMGEKEIAPIHNNVGIEYQALHPELEKWTTFTALPEIIQWDDSIGNLHKKIANGQVQVPDYMKTSFPPTLFAYFNTLPSFSRDHPAIRSIFMGLEHKQPKIDLQSKELALNYACSLMLPLSEDM
jgi:hypothetical protein